jgi:Fic family protein
MRVTGRTLKRTVAGEETAAFVPYPLPPRDPPLKVDGKLSALLTRAEQALARLEVAGEMVPSVDWFIYAFVRKEAVVSSQIEGTQATLIDLLEYEAEQATGVGVGDVHEVCNYLDAIKYARGQIRNARWLPLSMRLLNEAHRRLMRGVRGAHKQPGEIRCSQNWIGGTRPATPFLFPPHRKSCRRSWRTLRGIFTLRTGCRLWCALGWRTSSSRPSILTSMAMAVSVGC